jgi:DNA-binding Xre family transcriptional regulator
MNIGLKEVHVGKIIADRLFQLKMKKNEFAKQIGVPQQHVNRILERETMETSKLVKVCQVLDMNIFAEFCIIPSTRIEANMSSVLVGDGESHNHIGDAALAAELQKCKCDVEKFQSEKSLLEDQIATLKKLNDSNERYIKMLEGQNNIEKQ